MKRAELQVITSDILSRIVANEESNNQCIKDAELMKEWKWEWDDRYDHWRLYIEHLMNDTRIIDDAFGTRFRPFTSIEIREIFLESSVLVDDYYFGEEKEDPVTAYERAMGII